MSLHPPFGSGPVAVVIGCGDLAMSSARLVGRRHPLLMADIDPARLDAAAATLRTEGYCVGAQVCDITDAASVAGLAAAVPSAGLAALAHVAALAPSAGEFRAIMNVNLVGAHRVAEALLPLCSPGAAAVFVSSVAGHGPPPTPAIDAEMDCPLRPEFLDRLVAALGIEQANPSQAYALSKRALIRDCETWAVEWGPKGVRVLSVSPGLVLSSMGAIQRIHNPTTRTFADQTPLRREASLIEVSSVIDFALSDAASFISGVDILVDGGLRAARRPR